MRCISASEICSSHIWKRIKSAEFYTQGLNQDIQDILLSGCHLFKGGLVYFSTAKLNHI